MANDGVASLQDLYQACHDSCDQYKAWAERYKAQQKHLRDNKYRMTIPISPAREKTKRRYLKYGPGGRAKGGSQ